MNQLARLQRIAVVRHLLEGRSIRDAARLCAVSKNTTAKLLKEIAQVAYATHEALVRDVRFQRLRCSEALVGSWGIEIPNAAGPAAHGLGQVFVWTAIETRTNLIVAFLVGLRAPACLQHFLVDAAARLRGASRVTRDPQGVVFLEAVDGERVAADVSLAMLCDGCSDAWLTESSGEQVQRLAATVALHAFEHNFVRESSTSHITPAMAAALTDHAWTASELVSALDGDGTVLNDVRSRPRH